jgi:adenine-specific DNA-methyltransferase
MARPTNPKSVEALRHDERRVNIPTAEFESVVEREAKTPIRVAYERRNRDLDPQLVWRGKDEQDWSDLVVHAPPLYIQEKVHPKALIDDLRRESQERQHEAGELHADLFADFNGVPHGVDKTEFYQHDQNWTNRMILGDSLQVMASLAEREGLRGKVQCIYIDPPYGIKFNSNFQWSTTSRDVKDGNAAHITREPEQVRAFRDTWKDGIHSYLTYLRDRLVVARDLLTPSGSVFVQIGDQNVHLVRSLLDEVFGVDNAVMQIPMRTAPGQTADFMAGVADYLVWYARDRSLLKAHSIFRERDEREMGNLFGLRDRNTNERFGLASLASASGGATTEFPIEIGGKRYYPPRGRGWRTNATGISRLKCAERIRASGSTVHFARFPEDFAVTRLTNFWADVMESTFAVVKWYVVQTSMRIVERAILLASSPGDLILDPTCGSGTSAFLAEQWGRRWITVDTSRVALALARARIMGARYPYYLLADSLEGQAKEAEVTRSAPSTQPVRGDVRQGFVYERVPHITLKAIANNAEIDVIWDKWQTKLEPVRERLNAVSGNQWQEWEIPREAQPGWSDVVKSLHQQWWQARIARQKEIDASIAAKAEFEYLYDRPYTDAKKVRVAGPFTVESLSPHRTLAVDENDDLIDPLAAANDTEIAAQGFAQMVLENLRTAGVQQAHREDRISFTALTPWPGELICGEGLYVDGDGSEKRAAIFIGPEFGTVLRADLVGAAREAAEADFDVLIACAFNYEAHATEFDKLGRIPVLKARMNADLHMADDLKNTGKGNLFVIFGEPDIDILPAANDQVRVKVNGVDVFEPSTGEVRSDGADGIACWFIDTDYNEESFFVRHAYFLGANDPYSALKTTLKAEIDADAWATLHSDVSRPFPRPKSGRIAVKVINHLGDEVMKVFRV